MSNKPHNPEAEDDMQPEYDFSGGVRGKHYRAYQRGYKTTIHKADGSTEEREYTATEDSIILDPAVRAYFPDAESVNAALSGLIKLIPHEHASNNAS